MIDDHTRPGMVNNWIELMELKFSNKEKQRIQEICEELKEIFKAQRVDIYGEISVNLLEDYHIVIVDCPIE